MPNIEIPNNPTELWIVAVVIVLLITGIFTLLTLQQKSQATQEKEKTEMMKGLLGDLQKRATDCIESESRAKEALTITVRENGELRNEVKNLRELISKLRKTCSDADLSDTDELLLK